jgi:hypothetical protein
VEPLDTNAPIRQYRRSLLPVLPGIILVVQACSAYDLRLDQEISSGGESGTSQNISPGDSVVCNFYAHDNPVYRSVDNAGNTEVAKVKTVVIGRQGAASDDTAVPGTEDASSTPDSTSSRLPLWLIAVILIVIVAVIGGALYLKTRQGKTEPKK